MVFKQCPNAHADHTNFRVGLPCRHEVIWDVDIQQKAIHKLVTAWQEANTILLPVLVKIDSTSSVKRIKLSNLLQDHSALVRSTKNGTTQKQTKCLHVASRFFCSQHQGVI